MGVFLPASTRGTIVHDYRLFSSTGVRFPVRSFDFSIYLIAYFKPYCGPRVDIASHRNEYLESSWGWRAPFRHLWADFLENLGSSTSYNPIGHHELLLHSVILLNHAITFSFELCNQNFHTASAGRKELPNIGECGVQYCSKLTPWPQSASELHRPSGRHLSAKSVPTVTFINLIIAVAGVRRQSCTSICWAHLSRFQLKTETKSSPRNVVF
jgi:hypothetical protein